MIRVLIVSPGVATRVGLRTLLMDEPRIQIIGEAANLEYAEAEQSEVDLVLWAPGRAFDRDSLSLELLNQRIFEGAGLLLISDDPKMILVLASQKLHVWGLLSPEASREEIVAAIEAVNEDLVVTTPSSLEQLTQDRATPGNNESESEMIQSLTGRELEILQLLAQGLTNKQIAHTLSISAHTVKFHISSIFTKMGTTNRIETVKLGVKKGLILL